MKKITILGSFFALCFAISTYAQAPQTATNFTLNDCDGIEHNLFTELEEGNVIVIEFEMGCLPCVGGRKALAKIQNQFEATHPGKLRIYTMGYSANMKCATVQSWMLENSFFGPTFAGNADVITGYNAEVGMPTIVVLGGADHKILYWRDAFSNKDTVAIKAAISQILTSASVSDPLIEKNVRLYPNPSSSATTLTINCEKQGAAEVSLYNVSGVKVAAIYSGNIEKGIREIPMVTSELSTGKYYVHVTVNGATGVVPLTISR